jgi:hypothetical protein
MHYYYSHLCVVRWWHCEGGVRSWLQRLLVRSATQQQPSGQDNHSTHLWWHHWCSDACQQVCKRNFYHGHWCFCLALLSKKTIKENKNFWMIFFSSKQDQENCNFEFTWKTRAVCKKDRYYLLYVNSLTFFFVSQSQRSVLCIYCSLLSVRLLCFFIHLVTDNFLCFFAFLALLCCTICLTCWCLFISVLQYASRTERC